MNFVHTLEHHLLDHVFSRVNAGPLSFLFTKHLLVMWVAAGLAIALFVAAGQMSRQGKRNRWVLFVESLVVFVRDEIVLPNLGEEGRRYVPYFLSAFFFILLMNLVGLVPGSATPTGNISVTAALALCTFFMINVAGIRAHGVAGYVKSLVPHGMPVWLLPLMYPIELLGLLTKTFALVHSVVRQHDRRPHCDFGFLGVDFPVRKIMGGAPVGVGGPGHQLVGTVCGVFASVYFHVVVGDFCQRGRAFPLSGFRLIQTTWR
jgi:ATP synthase subunit 6